MKFLAVLLVFSAIFALSSAIYTGYPYGGGFYPSQGVYGGGLAAAGASSSGTAGTNTYLNSFNSPWNYPGYGYVM